MPRRNLYIINQNPGGFFEAARVKTQMMKKNIYS